MKHIKKYNEELNTSTYKSAANILKSMGHTRRAGEIDKWREKVLLDEENKRILDEYNYLSKYPSFDLRLLDSSGKTETELIKGKFFLQIWFEGDMLFDNIFDQLHDDKIYYHIPFLIAVCPADEKTKIMLNNVVENNGLEDHYWGGSLSCCWLEISLNSNVDIFTFEPRENIDIKFSNRQEVMKFKKLLSEALEGKNKFGESKYSDGIFSDINKWFTKIDDKLKADEHDPIDLVGKIPRLSKVVKNVSINTLYN